MPCFWLNPLATNLSLNLSIEPYALNLIMYTHLDPIGVLLGGNEVMTQFSSFVDVVYEMSYGRCLNVLGGGIGGGVGVGMLVEFDEEDEGVFGIVNKECPSLECQIKGLVLLYRMMDGWLGLDGGGEMKQVLVVDTFHVKGVQLDILQSCNILLEDVLFSTIYTLPEVASLFNSSVGIETISYI
ncbi:hypothetical protein Tco_0563729 [Tanacetum coccineum]